MPIPVIVEFGLLFLAHVEGFGQRVQKWQPVGGFAGLGTSPSRMICVAFPPPTGSGIGTADSSALV